MLEKSEDVAIRQREADCEVDPEAAVKLVVRAIRTASSPSRRARSRDPRRWSKLPVIVTGTVSACADARRIDPFLRLPRNNGHAFAIETGDRRRLFLDCVDRQQEDISRAPNARALETMVPAGHRRFRRHAACQKG
jgi:hypothetical protein